MKRKIAVNIYLDKKRVFYHHPAWSVSLLCLVRRCLSLMRGWRHTRLNKKDEAFNFALTINTFNTFCFDYSKNIKNVPGVFSNFENVTIKIISFTIWVTHLSHFPKNQKIVLVVILAFLIEILLI